MNREAGGESGVHILAPNVLCVDDDPHILVALRRTLSRHFCVDVANSGAQGLELLGKKRYAVVIVDMKMPGMNGPEFLQRAREVAPETTRILLTGNSDFDAAVLATNGGGIFRFVCKPYNPVEFPNTVADAVHQHHLLLAENDITHRTLAGTVNLLLEMAAVLAPGLTERWTRAREVATSVSDASGISRSQALENAALLFALACVTEPRLVPRGSHPTAEVCAALLARSRLMAERLLGSIPSYSQVRQLFERADHEALDSPNSVLLSPEALVFRLLLEREVLIEAGMDEERAREVLEQRGLYPRELLDALALDGETAELETEVNVADLEAGVRTRSEIVVKHSGQVLLRSGAELTRPVLERIRHYARSVGVVEPIRVVLKRRVLDRSTPLYARSVVGSDLVTESGDAASGTWKTK